jgi:hypothetical protein
MNETTTPAPVKTAAPADRKYLLERVGEAAVVQVYADGFRDLPLREQTLIWHLAQAAIAGRDIFYDQRYAHNLEMRDVLEAIVTHAAGVDRSALDEITRYTKLFWINTGPYNNLTSRKFVLACTPDAFAAAAHAAAQAGARFPLRRGETLDALLARLDIPLPEGSDIGLMQPDISESHETIFASAATLWVIPSSHLPRTSTYSQVPPASIASPPLVIVTLVVPVGSVAFVGLFPT